MGNQQNSASSSKLSIQNKATKSKVEVGEPEMKKMNTNDSSGDVQVAVEEKSINDLPPEMLMKILKNVDTPTLFACRLVNRQWNEISSEILRSRPDSEIRFLYSDYDSGFRSLTKRNKSLKDFVTCFKKSKNCALSYFDFRVINGSTSTYFDLKDWNELLSLFKNKSFKLKIWFFHDIEEFEVFTEKLRDLLNKIPHLEEVGLHFAVKSDSSQFKLFSTTEEDKNSSSVKLADLKVIHVGYSSFSNHHGIFQDLLTAAVNLKKIQPFFNDDNFFGHAHFDADYVDVNIFQFLYSLGKIHCLQTAHIELTPEFLSTVKNIKNSPFKLKKLCLFMETIRRNPSTWTDATSFVSNLLESSKTTLTMLSLTPVGFLHGLKFPTFTNLVEMKLIPRLDESALPLQMFPCGINSADVFPALRILDSSYMKDWSGVFPREDSIPLLKNVKSLSLIDHGITGSCISKLSLMCPNLKSLKVVKDYAASPQLNFVEVGKAIWTHMKQLESLEIDITIDVNVNTRNALDSCFTGISIQNCQRLQEAVKTLKKGECLSQVPDREYPSILELKDLKQLTVTPYAVRGLMDRNYFFTRWLTWISREYAFKLMPQLKLTTN